VNSKSATRLFYSTFLIFFWNFGIDYLYFIAVNAISKTNWPFLFPNSSYIVFGLTYYIVLKNDTLFVPSGQSPRSESGSVILSSWSTVLSGQIDVPKMSINHWVWGIFVNVLKRILSTSYRKNLGRERANLFLKYSCFSAKHAALRKKNQVYPRTVVSVS
jgi:hypothetical protein